MLTVLLLWDSVSCPCGDSTPVVVMQQLNVTLPTVDVAQHAKSTVLPCRLSTSCAEVPSRLAFNLAVIPVQH